MDNDLWVSEVHETSKKQVPRWGALDLENSTTLLRVKDTGLTKFHDHDSGVDCRLQLVYLTRSDRAADQLCFFQDSFPKRRKLEHPGPLEPVKHQTTS